MCPLKNTLLQQERGFGFTDFIASIDNGGLLDDIENLSVNFPNQRALVVALNGYAVFVPVEEGGVRHEDSLLQPPRNQAIF